MTRKLPIGPAGGPSTEGAAALDVAGEEDEDESHALVGRVLAGRYRATKVLGRGGIGVVLEATHLELDKKVAIKVLQASFARDAEALERFEREAKTAAKIGHPNIVNVLDLGRLETGEPFFVMEHLVGRDLESALGMPRKVLPLERVLELLVPIATALDALHAEGVIHRDVKPANVFLTDTKKGEVVKLVDFGLATLADAERKGARLTREGFIVGTAEYIAPECARGALGGPQADVYSFAVMAYELLSGEIPFDGAPLEVLLHKVSKDPPPLSSHSKDRYPAEVDAVLARSLLREPDERHATCLALVEDLRAALARPQGAAKATPVGRTPTADIPAAPTPSRGLAVGIAVVLVAGTLGALGWRFLGPSATIEEPPVAVLPPSSTTPVDVTATPEPTPEPIPTSVAPPAPVEAVVAVAAPTVEMPSTGSGPGRGRPRPTVGERAPAVATAEPPAAADPPPRVEPTPEPTPEPALEATPRASASDLVRQAQSALLHGEVASARDLFRDATRVSPGHAAAWRGLGIASEQLHEIPEARRAFERYLELSPDASDAGTIRDRLARLGG